jgi:hypothetical protein
MHDIHRVEAFDIVAAYTLRVKFEDRTEQLINFEPALAGELFGPLRNLSLFDEVRIDPEVHTLVWPNGADFDPATLHDWPKVVDALTAQAREWESVPA